MKTAPVLLVGLGDAQALVSKAVRTAFPAATVTVVGNLEEAATAGAPGGAELLVLGPGGKAEAERAAALQDDQGFPRWAVAILGGPAGTETDYTVLPMEADPLAMAELLRSALKLHRLRRENARLRGDLHTVASRVNHDLRTPLSPIYTSCEVLRLTLGPAVASHGPMIQSITNSVDELTALLDRVSFVLKASVSPKSKSPVLMGDAVFNAMGRVEGRLLGAKATVTQSKIWPEVPGVQAWLEAMWLHLLVNAVQHAGPLPQLELGWDNGGDDYRFWVRNAGKEIPPEKRGKLFQPFHQLHQTNATRGLGLSIVRRLVDLQGGRCGYEPLGAEGSRFYFTLPK
jgi:signal transduction histidine kinase